MEHWIIALIPISSAALMGAVGVYWRQKAIGDKLKDVADTLKDHIDPKNESPHSKCPVHTADIKTIKSDIREMKTDTKYLTRQMYALLVKQGMSPPKPPDNGDYEDGG